MSTEELKQAIQKIKDNGIKIHELSQESRELRAKIVEQIESLGLGKVTEEKPIRFLVESSIVSVVRAKSSNEITVTFEPINVI
jgi:biotin operon repressor